MDNGNKDGYTVLSSKYLFRRPWLTVREDSLRLPDGRINPEYYILEYPDWVNIIAITKEGDFVMERQYRHGIRATFYEIPAGVIFSDDSGLEVDILGGAPGVHTARYAGDDKDFNKNIDLLLQNIAIREMEASMAASYGISLKKLGRRARFRCVVTLILDGEKHYFEGTLEGKIAHTRSGDGGFGYDPVFIPDEYPDKTLSEISEEEKNAISHRGKALRAMAEWLAASQEASQA